MSNHRSPPGSLFVVESDARHKVLGMGYCKGCAKLLAKADGTPHKGMCWCKGECHAKYNLQKWGWSPGWNDQLDDTCSICKTTHEQRVQEPRPKQPEILQGHYQNTTEYREAHSKFYRERDAWGKAAHLVRDEVDHIVPLGLVDRSDPEAWNFWTKENQETKCRECHSTKTTGDVRHIKAARKGLRSFVRWADRDKYDPSATVNVNNSLFEEI